MSRFRRAPEGGILQGPAVRKLEQKTVVGAGRSVLVRAKLSPKGLKALEAKHTLRGVASKMGIVDATNGERGEIVVNLVRRPKASLLPGSNGPVS